MLCGLYLVNVFELVGVVDKDLIKCNAVVCKVVVLNVLLVALNESGNALVLGSFAVYGNKLVALKAYLSVIGNGEIDGAEILAVVLSGNDVSVAYLDSLVKSCMCVSGNDNVDAFGVLCKLVVFALTSVSTAVGKTDNDGIAVIFFKTLSLCCSNSFRSESAS